MKRRDFIKTSVGAGYVVTSLPKGLMALAPQEVRGTFFGKVWDSHVVANLGGDTDLLYIDRYQMADGGPSSVHRLLEEGLRPATPEVNWAVMDHSASTSPDRYSNPSLNSGDAWRQFQEYREELSELGILSFGHDDPRHGIQHVVGPESGLILPGMLVAAGDSHTCTLGGVGCVSWGGSGGRNVLLTGTVIRQRPRVMRVNVVGTLGEGLGPKDVILRTIGQLGTDSGNGFAVEYAGPVVRAMSVDNRLTICNLAIEMAAASGSVAPDDTTYEWVEGREFAPRGAQWDQALAYWRTLPSDPDAVFDREETIDMTGVEPQVTWGVNPEHVVGISGRVPGPDDAPADKREVYQKALDYTGLTPGDPIAGTPLNEAFIGSCAESRISDLRAAARVVEGRRVAPGVLAWVVAGSIPTKRQAEAEGLDRIFKDAGFDWREPSCSKCVGMNGDHVPPGHRCISNSNRNYIGRQGQNAITHLASAPMVAAGAIAGRIVDVRRLMAGEPV